MNRLEIGVEYGSGERGSISPDVLCNIDDFIDDMRWRIIALYNLSVLQEVVLRENSVKPRLLIMKRHIDDVQRREGEDERENGSAEVDLPRFLFEKCNGERVDAAERADH